MKRFARFAECAWLLLLVSSVASTAYAAPELYGTEIGDDSVFTVNLATGAATVIGTLLPTGSTSPQVEGLAFNPETRQFFGVNNDGHLLLEISPISWQFTIAATLPPASYSALARSPTTGLLYTNPGYESLGVIDPFSGELTRLTSPGSGVYIESLAFDSTGRLFGIGHVDGPTDALYEFDLTSGAVLSAVQISSDLENPRFDNSLAIHPETREFYSVATIEGGLYRIDPMTGIATRIGDTGMRNVRALDFAVPVPEPSSLATCFLAVAVVAGVAWRRSWRASNA